MSTKQAVREFISQNLVVFSREAKFADSDDIFALGFVDSMFALRLVQFVESQYGVKVANEDLDRANFCSVDAITGFVARKQGGRP